MMRGNEPGHAVFARNRPLLRPDPEEPAKQASRRMGSKESAGASTKDNTLEFNDIEP
jgi:hypothetical protein